MLLGDPTAPRPPLLPQMLTVSGAGKDMNEYEQDGEQHVTLLRRCCCSVLLPTALALM